MVRLRQAAARKIRTARPLDDALADLVECRADRRAALGAGEAISERTPPLESAVGAAPGLTYLNHAAAGVLPHATRDALRAIVDGQAERGVLGFAAVERRLPEMRDRIGRFIGAPPKHVALLRNTGDGANVVARGLDWAPGDEIVLCDNEFGSNAMPWLALRESGVAIRFVHAPDERMTPDV